MEITLSKRLAEAEPEFREEMAKISLPGDMDKLQSLIGNFFENRIITQEYLSSLNLYETALLNSVLKIMSCQLSMLNGGCAALPNSVEITDMPAEKSEKDGEFQPDLQLGGAVMAAALLGRVMGYWGLALAAGGYVGYEVYRSAKDKFAPSKNIDNSDNSRKNTVLDIDGYIQSFKSICLNIDNIISGHRTCINNVKREIEEAHPRMTLANSYSNLLERCSYVYAEIKNTENTPKNLNDEILRLYKTLNNYHYKFVDYSEETAQFYEVSYSNECDKVTLFKAAVLEDGICIISGKCVIPESKEVEK